MSQEPVETNISVISAGRAGDAGFLAADDLSRIALELQVEYRLIGGNAVTLLVAAHGVSELVPTRETADADFGADYGVVADPRLPAALYGRGYKRESGNRFRRRLATSQGELDLVIDVLAPAYVGRLRTNQTHGELVVDEVPGLALALARPATRVRVDVRLTSGTRLVTVLAIPDVASALCLKAYAYRGRFEARDALDIWRLLEAAHAAGIGAADWPKGGVGLDAARILHSHFGLPSSRGPLSATASRRHQARIRALVAQVVGTSRQLS